MNMKMETFVGISFIVARKAAKLNTNWKKAGKTIEEEDDQVLCSLMVENEIKEKEKETKKKVWFTNDVKKPTGCR